MMTAPNVAQLAPAILPRGSCRELAFDSRRDIPAQTGIVGHENGLRRSIVLGLSQQVCRQPLGIMVACRR